MSEYLDLPAPAGVDHNGDCAWWRMSDGDRMYACPGQVYGPPYDDRSLDELEADALTVLAAVAWARRAAADELSNTPMDTPAGRRPSTRSE